MATTAIYYQALKANSLNTVSFSNFSVDGYPSSTPFPRPTRIKDTDKFYREVLPSTSMEANFKKNLSKRFNQDEVIDILKIYRKTVHEQNHSRDINQIMSNATIAIKMLFPNDRIKYGIEANIDGKRYTIKFNSIDSLIIYHCMLLRIKQGKHLYKNELIGKKMNNLQNYNQSESQEWLKAAFQSVCSYNDFSEWIDANSKKTHRLDQAVSAIKRSLNNALAGLPEEVINRFLPSTHKTQNGKAYSYYTCGLRPENISISDKFQSLISTADIIE